MWKCLSKLWYCQDNKHKDIFFLSGYRLAIKWFDIPCMQSSKEQQGEIRKPSSVISTKNRGRQQNGKDQRSLQENQRYQGNISCKDGSIKDRNSMDLTEAEDIKKRWQEYTELYKNIFTTQIIMKVRSLTLSQTSWNVKSSGP